MSDARRLATGSLAQQAAQVTGLLALLAIFTVLARRLSLPELGVYGLLNALAGYLLIVQNAAAGSAVRAMAAARDERAASAAFSTAALLYAGAGLLAGLMLAGLGLGLAAALELSDELARQARLGAVAAGVVTFVGWPVSVYRDALRARGRFVLAAGIEVGALLAYVTLVIGLAFADAPLWAILGAGAGISLLVGVGCAVAATVVGLPWRLRPSLADGANARALLGVAGYISLTEAASAAVYVLSRLILGLFKSAATVGLYELPVRAHNLVRALNAAVPVVVLPAASAYHAAGDDRRLRELLLRGSRYMLALVVPIVIVGMTLASPILVVWADNPEFGEGGTAMAILLSHWLLNAISGVAAAMLIAVGRARELARWALLVAGGSVLLALALVPPFGLEGVALATTIPYVALFPYLLRITLRAIPIPLRELALRAFLPAWALGLVLGAALVAVRLLLDPESLPAVIVTAAAGLLAYWAAYFLLWLDRNERTLVRSLLSRS